MSRKPDDPKKRSLSRYKTVRKPLDDDVKSDSSRALMARHAYELRHALNLTQVQMAERTGIQDSTIGAVERGGQNMTLDTVDNFARSYGVDVHHLICGAEYTVPLTTGLTLDLLAAMTRAIDERVQQIFQERGAVSVDKTALASIASALFDLLANPNKYAAAPSRKKTKRSTDER